MGACAQVKAKGDGSNIKMLLADHCQRFGDLFRGDLHGNDPFRYGFNRPLNFITATAQWGNVRLALT